MVPLWLIVGGATTAAFEALQNLLWARRRSRLYDEAARAAAESGRPLLVVGRPRGRGHGCGDVCVDIVGAPECPGGMAADVRDLSAFPDGAFGAAFVGHVLESLGDGFDRAVAEIHRVAARVFVAHMPDTSLSSRLHPESSCVIHSAPPETPWYVYTPISDGRTFMFDPRGRPRALGQRLVPTALPVPAPVPVGWEAAIARTGMESAEHGVREAEALVRSRSEAHREAVEELEDAQRDHALRRTPESASRVRDAREGVVSAGLMLQDAVDTLDNALRGLEDVPTIMLERLRRETGEEEDEEPELMPRPTTFAPRTAVPTVPARLPVPVAPPVMPAPTAVAAPPVYPPVPSARPWLLPLALSPLATGASIPFAGL